MKKLFYSVSLVIIVLFTCSAQQACNPALTRYVQFLGTQHTSAKEYILNLFNTHDIVVICERDHRDISQYDLYFSIIKDQRFIDSVGCVFTEIGVSSITAQVQSLLHAGAMPADSVDRAILGIQRNCSFYPLWEKTSYSKLLKTLYEVNTGLPDNKKISMFPADMPFTWDGMDVPAYKKFWDTVQSRDSIIASQVIHTFDSLKASSSPRKKALVIMNYRHAFGKRFMKAGGVKPNNVGRFLYEHYRDAVANVYLNYAALKLGSTDSDVSLVPVNDGKWDAAFQYAGITDAGFDFEGSPFGGDPFDIWPRHEGDFTFTDVFTGFAFYLPLNRHLCSSGVPGFIDASFLPEYLRRDSVVNTATGKPLLKVTDLATLQRDINTKHEFQMDGLDSMYVKINAWLK